MVVISGNIGVVQHRLLIVGNKLPTLHGIAPITAMLPFSAHPVVYLFG